MPEWSVAFLLGAVVVCIMEIGFLLIVLAVRDFRS